MTSRAPGPPPSRPALSRLPRWVTVLGLVLVVLAVAALLAKGPIGRAIGGHGGMRTVVLKADDVPVPGIPCGQSPCAPEVRYTTPTGSATYDGDIHDPSRSSLLPFTKTVRVRAGGTVTLDAAYIGAQWITCSITVNGTVVSKNTPAFTATTRDAHCQSVIP